MREERAEIMFSSVYAHLIILYIRDSGNVA